MLFSHARAHLGGSADCCALSREFPGASPQEQLGVGPGSPEPSAPIPPATPFSALLQERETVKRKSSCFSQIAVSLFPWSTLECKLSNVLLIFPFL